MGEDFATKIRFWGGQSAFVEFETADDCTRALDKTGQLIGDKTIIVTRPSGILMTSGTGQKFTLQTKARNVSGPSSLGTSHTENKSSIEPKFSLDAMPPPNIKNNITINMPNQASQSAHVPSTISNSTTTVQSNPTGNQGFLGSMANNHSANNKLNTMGNSQFSALNMNPVAPEFRPSSSPSPNLPSNLLDDSFPQGFSGLGAENDFSFQSFERSPNFPLPDSFPNYPANYFPSAEHFNFGISQSPQPSFSLDDSMFPPLSSDSKGN